MEHGEKTLRYIDLFAGCGGFRLGIERAFGRFAGAGGPYSRCRCVFANEWDKWCCAVYNRNFGERLRPRDIRSVEPDDIPGFDLLCAGFPCQPFSVAGRRQGFKDSRGRMFLEIAGILEAKRPPFVLLENVKGLLNHDAGKTFAHIVKTLETLGYGVQWMVLNSRFFGVPQDRQRVFVVAGPRTQPGPEILPFAANGQAAGGTGRPPDKVSGTLRAGYAKQDNVGPYVREWLIRGGQGSNVYSIDGPSITILGSTGGQGGQTGLYAIPRSKRGKSAVNGKRQEKIEQMRVRRLTPLECERLQGFPEGWTKQGLHADGEGITLSNTQRYRMLGNAVTTHVVEAIVAGWFGKGTKPA